MTTNGRSIFWKPKDPPPSELANQDDVFLSTFIPRCLAWISVDDDHKVALLEGYNAVCYTPPTLMLSSAAVPKDMIEKLRTLKRCSLSLVTSHESSLPVLQMASAETPPSSSSSSSPKSHEFQKLGLQAAKARLMDYPSVVVNSPIHYYCTLEKEIDLSGATEANENGEHTMLLLTMDTVVVDGSVLSPPTELMKGRDVTAKIDCDLLQPWLGLGHARYSQLATLRRMSRPTKSPDGSWQSTELEINEASPLGPRGYESMEWSFRRDGRSCCLGYNPVTAIVLPRPIGWISTYRQDCRVPHLAPYSFFTDVSRGAAPMVAFSGFRRDGVDKKDAQLDAEDMKCFGYNMVSEDLAKAMNYSAAELGRTESEFDLAGLAIEEGKLVDAPLVRDAKIRYECEYVRTIDVGTFSIVIGRVAGVHISPDIITEGFIDPNKARPITRLGYINEYGVLPNLKTN